MKGSRMKGKNLFRLFLILLVSSFIIFSVGCKKDESPVEPTPQVNESEILLKHFEETNDYIHTTGAFVVSATDVRTMQLSNPNRQLLIDIRAAADFTAGRIAGAVNVPFNGLYDYMKTVNPNNYDRIVVICYSGQTSAYAVSLIRAMGGFGNKVVSLKFGMSSWDSVFAQNYWLAKRSNIRAGQFVNTPSPAKNPKGDLPKLNTGKKTAPEILEARIRALLSEGYPPATISENTMYSNLNNYYIINYWPNSLYLDPGHVQGAILYDPATQPFKSSNDLKTLPTNKTTVLYCFTGQTSSYIGAYLRLLGYDVKSLTYGANSMIYDLMRSKNVPNTFIPENEIKRYPYISGN
jgi:rhodanese-related sulfurtransferase